MRFIFIIICHFIYLPIKEVALVICLQNILHYRGHAKKRVFMCVDVKQLL